MREFRCRLFLETTLEAGDEEEAMMNAISELNHCPVDEGVEDEQIVVLLEERGSPLTLLDEDR